MTEDPGANHPNAIPVAIPHGFDQGEALQRIAQYAAAQLHAGMSEREIMHRLHGYQRTEEGVTYCPKCGCVFMSPEHACVIWLRYHPAGEG